MNRKFYDEVSVYIMMFCIFEQIPNILRNSFTEINQSAALSKQVIGPHDKRGIHVRDISK